MTAMNLRLSDEEFTELRELATGEHRSMNEVARLAIQDRLKRNRRHAEVQRAVDEIIEERQELLDRLSDS